MANSRLIEQMTVEIASGTQEADSEFITDEESRQLWREIKADFDDMADTDTPMGFSAEWDNSEIDLDSLLSAGWEQRLTDYLDEAYGENATSLVSKSVNERRYTLGPMYVPDRIDAHNEWTDATELQKSVWDYVRKGDRRIRLQHNRDVVAGEWVEIMAWPYESSVPMQKADGTFTDMTFPPETVFLGVVWEPWAWELVKKGELRGYSVGGRAQRLEVDLPVAKEDGGSPAAPVSGPTVQSVHVDTVMGQRKKRTRGKDVSGEVNADGANPPVAGSK